MIQEFEINKETIEQFEHPDWQRNIRLSTINKFKKSLKEDSFFGTLITVNKINGKFRLINGNHRLRAIKESLFKINKIKVILDIYENLTESEEKDIFSKISIESSQTLDDYLYIHKEEIPIFNKLSNFPINISIYPHKSSIRLSTFIKIVKSIRNRQLECDFSAMDRGEALNIAMEITENEFICLKKFFNLFKQSVGGIINNSLYKPIVLLPIADIFGRYFMNPYNPRHRGKGHGGWTDNDWINLFKKIMTDHIILSYAEMNTSREKMRDVRERILFLSRTKSGYARLL